MLIVWISILTGCVLMTPLGIMPLAWWVHHQWPMTHLHIAKKSAWCTNGEIKGTYKHHAVFTMTWHFHHGHWHIKGLTPIAKIEAVISIWPLQMVIDVRALHHDTWHVKAILLPMHHGAMILSGYHPKLHVCHYHGWLYPFQGIFKGYGLQPVYLQKDKHNIFLKWQTAYAVMPITMIQDFFAKHLTLNHQTATLVWHTTCLTLHHLQGSAKAYATLTKGAINVYGTVHALKGSFIKVNKTHSPSNFPKSHTYAPLSFAMPLPIDVNLVVKIHPAVSIQYPNLNSHLRGQLTIHAMSVPHHRVMPIITGKLQLLNGQFLFKNIALPIQHGQLLYDGNNLNNPNIYIKIEKSVQPAYTEPGRLLAPIQVGALVTGTLKNPSISLFSNQMQLNNRDILLYLMGSRHTMQSSDWIINMFNVAALNPLRRPLIALKRYLALDAIQFNAVSQLLPEGLDALRELSISIEKMVTDRYHIYYTQSLMEPMYLLKNEYALTPVWHIAYDYFAGGSAFDIMYTRG
jgi:TamB, inner membrane protein subunit of TAM complex